MKKRRIWIIFALIAYKTDVQTAAPVLIHIGFSLDCTPANNIPGAHEQQRERNTPIAPRKWCTVRNTDVRIFVGHQATPRPERFVIYALTSSSSAVRAAVFALMRSCLLSRAALVFARLASISSLSLSSRAFSALALWICVACQKGAVCTQDIMTWCHDQLVGYLRARQGHACA